MRSFTLLFAVSAMLSACATRPVAPAPAEIGEAFVLERDLAGQTVARGRFKPIIGKSRGFDAYLDGAWDGETLTLVEDFEYDDGEVDRKTWRLTKVGEGRYTGVREDVVGEADGFMDGDAFRLEYVVRLGGENGEGGRKVKFRDILYKRADGVVINRATVGYYGLRAGAVELEIRPGSFEQ
ncbi:MAG: DUF3833 family protein [Hyphococcus sp.]